MRLNRLFEQAAAFVLLATFAAANVLVYDVQVDTGVVPNTISYRLLDTPDTVKIEVFGPLPATTVVGQIDGDAQPELFRRG